MRVAFLTYEYPPCRGGIGSYAFNIAKYLKRGHNCIVFSEKSTGADLPIFEDYLVKRGAGFVNGWRVWNFITRLIRWDVVFAVEVDAAYPAFWLSFCARVPLVVAVLGNDVLMAQKDGLRRFLSKLVFKRARKIICISRFTESLMHTYYPFCQGKTVVIHPGVDVEKKNKV